MTEMDAQVLGRLEAFETPFAVVDLERVRANVARVSGYAAQHELSLRPHTKTHKHPEIAALQVKAGAHGLTVATPREAEVMAPFAKRLLVAYPPVDPGRIDRLCALAPRHGTELDVALDSEEAIERIAAAARKHGITVGILIELDLGGRRTGVDSYQALVRLARRVSGTQSVRYRGIMFHPGHIRRPSSPSPRSRYVSDLERLNVDLSHALEALERADLTPTIVSGGNTPTLFDSHRIRGMTEIRPGTYVYGDRDTHSQGVTSWNDSAYSILATVVSTAIPGQAVIDAGSKALSKETLPDVAGYGCLLNHPEVVLKSLSEEHGVLDLSNSTLHPRVGDRVRVVPNHVCVSVNLQDRIAFLDGEEVRTTDVPARGRARVA